MYKIVNKILKFYKKKQKRIFVLFAQMKNSLMRYYNGVTHIG